MKRKMYTMETLKEENAEFLLEPGHEIHQDDVVFVNHCINMMRNGTESELPKTGDIIQYTTRDGKFYRNAHIDSIHNGVARVCLAPYIPFITVRDTEIKMDSVSGGPWTTVPVSCLKKAGKSCKPFRYISPHILLGAHCAISFTGYATCWRYNEPNPMFGAYSTEQYNRILFTRTKDGWYVSSDTSVDIPDSDGFASRMHELKATTFGDFEKDTSVVVFVYKELNLLIPREQWMAMEFPMSTRRINGFVPVKLQTDDKNKTVTVYRYCNG